MSSTWLHGLFSRPELDSGSKPVGGLIIASKRPAMQICGPAKLHNPNAALFVQVHRHSGPPLLVANVHLRGSDSIYFKDLFVTQVIEHAASFDCDILAIGDWNTEPFEGCIAPLIANELLGSPETDDEAR